MPEFFYVTVSQNFKEQTDHVFHIDDNSFKKRGPTIFLFCENSGSVIKLGLC